MPDGSSPAPARPLRRFWLGEPPHLEERSAEEVLQALEQQGLDLSTPLRVSPDSDPTPVARYLRELVWIARREHAAPQEEVSLFQAAFDHAPFGLVIADLAGRILRTNTEFASLLGHRPEALVGVGIGQLTHGPSRAEELALGNEMMAGRRSSFQVEKAFLASTGERVDTLTAVALVQDAQGGPSAVVAHVLDLRTRKALEVLVEEQTRARRESEERFERLFRRAPQAMIMVDGAGRVAHTNEAALRLFGYAAAELDGRPLAELIPEGLWGAQGPPLAEPWESASADRATPILERAGVRKDGRRLTVEIGVVPVTVDGSSRWLAGVADVTEARQARVALQASLEEKETLLREIHHRVKNNLQIVSSLLAMQADRLPTGEARAGLSDSVARVRSMALVHQQLYSLDSLARIDLRRYAEELTPALAHAFRPEARILVMASPVQVSVDLAVPLGLILNELISNSLKYAFPPGPVDPTSEEGGWDLRVRVEQDGRSLVIGVDDHGPGLPAELTHRPGSLGMTLVRSLVRQVQGRFEARSADGARIEVRCPLG